MPSSLTEAASTLLVKLKVVDDDDLDLISALAAAPYVEDATPEAIEAVSKPGGLYDLFVIICRELAMLRLEVADLRDRLGPPPG